MLNSQQLDETFRALGDPTRRRIVEQLTGGPASVSQLARPLPMSLPAVHQHLQVLEGAGLVRSEKRGRVRWCELDAARMRAVEGWILARRRSWERRLDRLEAHLEREPPRRRKKR